MTEIAFHFHVPDKLGYSCRLLRKAYLSGSRVLVTGSSAELERLDQALWTFSPVEFVPHCRVLSDGYAKVDGSETTEVVLMESPDESPHHQVLVNLGQAVPKSFERYERVIEIVTEAEDDRLAARQRWKHYADRGYSLKRHDLSGKGDSK